MTIRRFNSANDGRHSGQSAQMMRQALALVERGVLTEAAAWAIAYFGTYGPFCQLIQRQDQQSDGDVTILFRAHRYAPAAWNALVADSYPPTDDDVLASVAALAPMAALTGSARLSAATSALNATPEPDEPTAEPDEPDEDPQQPTPPPDGVVAGLRALTNLPDDEPPAAPPAPGTPEAEAQLAAIHQAASKRPGGAGALAWGLLALGAVVFGGIAALGFWQVAQVIWGR
jgi:hypothetical protein